MSSSDLKDMIQILQGRPLPKEILAFFEYKQGNRVFLTITEDSAVWKTDLKIAESMFADIVICPSSSSDAFLAEISQVKDILKQRMKYPNIQENPALEQIARTWILPTKVHMGPALDTFLFTSTETTLQKALESNRETILGQDPLKIHLLKIEVQDGKERPMLYKLLDEGFRPSLLLVKWSNDVDEHVATAHCAGHLLNSGYATIAYENGYSLYLFNDQVLYDICSMKEPSLKNPIMQTLLTSASEVQRSKSSQSSTIQTSTSQPDLAQNSTS